MTTKLANRSISIRVIIYYFRSDELIVLGLQTSEKWSLSTITTAAAAAIQHS